MFAGRTARRAAMRTIEARGSAALRALPPRGLARVVTMAISMLSPAVSTMAFCMPTKGMSTKPPTKDPSMPPTVLSEYMRPIFSPTLSADQSYILHTSGKVAPKRKVGTMRVMKDVRKFRYTNSPQLGVESSRAYKPMEGSLS